MAIILAGIPAEATSARRFFSNRGWKDDEPNFDLVSKLGDYTTPSWVHYRLAIAGVHLRLAEPTDGERIMSFEQCWFPAWADFFRNAKASMEHHNTLIDLDSGEEVVGAVILRAHVHAVWNADIGVSFGTLNVLGVAANQQGRGTGVALAARAM